MAYDSKVCLVIKRELFTRILQEEGEALKSLITQSDKFQKKDDAILLHWDSIDWYLEDTDGDVGRLWRCLQNGEHKAYYLVKINEDITESGGYWDNPWETHAVCHINIKDVGENIGVEAFY